MILTSALCVLVAAAPPKPFVEDVSVEGITQYHLPNGLRVLTIPDTSKPSATVNMTILVGSRNESYGEHGMAHLLEHLLFKETKKFKDVKSLLTKLGGDANGTTWFDRTNYFESFPASDANVKTAIEIEAERLVNTIITREKLAPEMTVVRNEFERGENDPRGVLSQRLISSAFMWHNYGNDTIGPKSDIELVPQERIQNFYKTYYQPDNALLIIAGKFDQDKTLKLIADTFGKIPKPTRVLPKTYTEEPVQDGERGVTVRRVGGVPVIAIGYHVAATTDPDAAALQVLDNILSNPPAGRLYKDLVETKKAAEAYCEPFLLKEAGYFTCYAMLREKDAPGPARDALLNAVEKFTAKAVTDDDVSRAKTSVLKGYELLLNSTDQVGIVLSEFAGAGDWRLLFLERENIKKVTAADVMRVSAKYFKASNRTLGEYVPTEKPDRVEVPQLVDIAPQLAAFKGGEAMSQGEVFDISPKNIDSRVVKSTLPNGLKLALLTKKTRGETVHFHMDLRFGSEESLKGQRFNAGGAQRMLQRGTKSKSRQQFQDALDALKAKVEFSQHPQGVSVSVEVRRPQLKETLDLVAEALKEPAFDAAEFEAARRELLSVLEQQKDDPNAIGSMSMQRMMSIFPEDHPLGVLMFDKLIPAISAAKIEDVRAFHARFYGAQNAEVAVVGDFDAKEVTDQLTKHFGSWTAKEKYVRIPTPFKATEVKGSETATPDKSMAFFAGGTHFQMKDTDPDYPAMVMADYMLGGGFLNGRIPQRLREKDGLSYGAGTRVSVDSEDDSASLVGYAIYNPTNLSKIEKGFKEELDRAVASGFTADELNLARQGLLQEREQQRAQDEVLAYVLTDYLNINRTFAYDTTFEDKVKSLTPAEVSAALKKYIDPKKFGYVKVGDFKKVAAPK